MKRQGFNQTWYNPFCTLFEVPFNLAMRHRYYLAVGLRGSIKLTSMPVINPRVVFFYNAVEILNEKFAG